MNKTAALMAMTVAGSLAAALTMSAPGAAAGKEKCYGIAMKGQNDCAAGSHDCKGMSKVNFDKASFKLVPKGTCTSMVIKGHQGKLKPA
jgi:uncharacterized membrane protein